MMNSVAPFWDGNETWLVLGGGGLFVAFPMAYGIIMSGLYLPVIIMLLALVFRGVAFEFRWVAKPHHQLWDLAFAGGSITAAFTQGIILGGLLQGITVENGAFAGGTFDWLTPFALFCGLATVAGYALLGATWLVMKTEGPVAERARGHAKLLLARRPGRAGDREPVDAARLPAHLGALVHAAQSLLSFTDPAPRGARRLHVLARARDAP